MILWKSASEVSILMTGETGEDLLYVILFKGEQRGAHGGFGRKPNCLCKSAMKE